jgi:hypothetical protein
VTDPRMWPLFFMGPESSTAKTVMSAGFGTQVAVGAYQQTGELGKIMDNPVVGQFEFPQVKRGPTTDNPDVLPEDKWELAQTWCSLP